MDGAKVRLSQEERTILMNPGWILTKNSIMGKVGELLAGLSEDFQRHFPEAAIERIALQGFNPQHAVSQHAAPDKDHPLHALPQDIASPHTARQHTAADHREPLHAVPRDAPSLPPNWASPKISKGENYKGLPWMVLDYPRAFGREEVLAIRTLFWWGHYFSVTLHLKGRYKECWLPVIRERMALLAKAGFHVGVSDDEWRHELDSDNYLPLGEDMDTVIGKERHFLKLSAKCGLDRWDDASSVLLELFRVLVGVLTPGAIDPSG